MVLNASFRIRSEPIAESSEDAFRCFMVHVRAVGGCLLRKEEQEPSMKRNYKSQFELD